MDKTEKERDKATDMD